MLESGGPYKSPSTAGAGDDCHIDDDDDDPVDDDDEYRVKPWTAQRLMELTQSTSSAADNDGRIDDDDTHVDGKDRLQEVLATSLAISRRPLDKGEEKVRKVMNKLYPPPSLDEVITRAKSACRLSRDSQTAETFATMERLIRKWSREKVKEKEKADVGTSVRLKATKGVTPIDEMRA